MLRRTSAPPEGDAFVLHDFFVPSGRHRRAEDAYSCRLPVTVAEPLRVRLLPFGPVVVVERFTVLPSRLVSDVFVAVCPPAPVADFVFVKPSSVFSPVTDQVPVSPCSFVRVPLPAYPSSVFVQVPSEEEVRPPGPVCDDDDDQVPSPFLLASLVRELVRPAGPVVVDDRLVLP